MSILVGTCSWSSRTLVDSGRFYPPGVGSPEARLRYCASRFPLVEVDSSYYAIPAPATAQLWAERTPDAFTMNVKAFRLFTGRQTSPTVLPKDLRAALPPSTRPTRFMRDVPGDVVDELWHRFAEALRPLAAAGRLGLAHFQFPPWVFCDAVGPAHVRRCAERMAGQIVSVEFRQRSWFADERATASKLAFERDLGVVHIVVDGPRGFVNSVPAVWAATRPRCALLRLHGRNADTWNIKGARDSSERFNYDYPNSELGTLAEHVRRLATEAMATHVVFNNNLEDHGQCNAASLAALLRD